MLTLEVCNPHIQLFYTSQGCNKVYMLLYMHDSSSVSLQKASSNSRSSFKPTPIFQSHITYFLAFDIYLGSRFCFHPSPNNYIPTAHSGSVTLGLKYLSLIGHKHARDVISPIVYLRNSRFLGILLSDLVILVSVVPWVISMGIYGGIYIRNTCTRSTHVRYTLRVSCYDPHFHNVRRAYYQGLSILVTTNINPLEVSWIANVRFCVAKASLVLM